MKNYLKNIHNHTIKTLFLYIPSFANSPLTSLSPVNQPTMPTDPRLFPQPHTAQICPPPFPPQDQLPSRTSQDFSLPHLEFPSSPSTRTAATSPLSVIFHLLQPSSPSQTHSLSHEPPLHLHHFPARSSISPPLSDLSSFLLNQLPTRQVTGQPATASPPRSAT